MLGLFRFHLQFSPTAFITWVKKDSHSFHLFSLQEDAIYIETSVAAHPPAPEVPTNNREAGKRFNLGS